MVALTESWLQQRTANVVCERHFSDNMVLKNMVFQGTVLGPSLWNLFYEDARRAIHETGFEEIVYADDLNGFKEFEHMPASSQLLGICFDCKLWMDLAVRDVVSQASWKVTTILRTRRFHGVSQLVQVYKSKVFSFVEYRTSAVYHAAKTSLAGIDAVQRRFLRELGLSVEDFQHFSTSLHWRLDGTSLCWVLIHRSVLGGGPMHFANMLLPSPPSASQKHVKQLLTHRSPRHWQILSRSALGLVDVYNLFPAQVVCQRSVGSHAAQTSGSSKIQSAER